MAIRDAHEAAEADDDTHGAPRRRWLLLSNCQATGMRDCLHALAPGIDVVAYDIAAYRDARSEVEAKLAHFDRFVVTPDLQDALTIPDALLDRLILLPPLYFEGLHPDNVYLSASGPLANGPLGHYHSMIAYAAYAAGFDVDAAAGLYGERHLRALGYFEAWARARDRTQLLYEHYGYDIGPALLAWSRSGAFMHAVNHPRIHVLMDMARMVLRRAGESPVESGIVPADHLAQGPSFPLYPALGRALGMKGSLWFKAGGSYQPLHLHEFLRRSFASYEAAGPARPDFRMYLPAVAAVTRYVDGLPEAQRFARRIPHWTIPDMPDELEGQPSRYIRRIIRDSGVGFGTSGARGLVTALSDDVVGAYVRAFIAMLRESGLTVKSVALGMDLRPSSARIAGACLDAFSQAAVKPDWCGVLPTPALALHAMSAGIPAVMVSGSHIPFDRNGLKFYRPDGEITKQDEAAMLEIERDMPPIRARPLPDANPAALAAYVRRATEFFPAAMLAGRRIGLYEHSSASRDVFGDILAALGAEVVSLGRTDQFVPIDTEAVSPEDAARGVAWAREHRLDAIVSTDGDGDRPLIAGEDGVWLRGDIVGLLCARELGIEALAVPVSCNTAIEASGAFAEVLRTRIGSPHVIAGMEALRERHARVAGFEANGGFLLGTAVESGRGTLQPLPTRDAVLPALAVFAAGHRAGVPVSALPASLPQRHTASDRLQDFPTVRSKGLLAEWAADPDALMAWLGLGLGPVAAVDTTDGLRMALASGEIVHLRPSGNAPELRCYCEADRPERAAALVRAVLDRLTTI